MDNIAKPITQEECQAVAELYERILKAMRQNKISSTHHYHIWDSLKHYWVSREPRFKHDTNFPMPANWSFQQNLSEDD